MHPLKLTVTAILVFSLATPSLNLHAQSTTTGTATTAQAPVQDTVPQDTALVSCQADADCSTASPNEGKGCFRLREDDIFGGDAQSANGFSSQSAAQDTVDADREDNGVDTGPNDELDGLKDGEKCTSSSQCDSYFCEPTSRVCVEKKICRFGDMGETVPPGVKCEEGYIVNAQGVCDLSEEDKRLVYLGLLEGDVELRSQNKCSVREYQNDPATKEIRDKAIVSMKTLRAMEWLFATSSLEEKDECLKLLPFLRDEMAKKYNDDRKKVLNNFNVEMAKIEKDTATILNAKKNSTAIVNVHGEDVKEGDLESRKHSGYDAMKIMWRRNLLFQAYENAMTGLIKAAGAKIGGLAEEMGNWKDKSKKWTVGGKEWTYKTAGRCRGKKAKKIKKRWASYYQINATTPENAEVVKRPAIADYLSLVSGDDQDGVQRVLTSGPKQTKFSQYFLVDPLMPGGKGNTSFDKFGTGQKGKRLLGATAFPELYSYFRERIVAFYKEMKGASAPEGFVYEPEIISTEAKDCMEKPDGENCGLYKEFIDEMTDVAFAQFLAYSIHSKNSYKKYFPNSMSLRRKLLAKLEVDFQNVTKYYESMQKARDDQSKCIESQINSVAKQFLTDPAGVGEGGTSGTSEAQGGAAGGALGSSGTLTSTGGGTPVTGLSGLSANSSGTASTLTAGSARLSGSSLLLDEKSRLAFTPNLLASGNSAAPTTTAGSASLTGSAATFAARLEKMKTANARAKLVGIDVKNTEKKTAPALQNLGQTIGGGNTSGSSQVASLGLSGSQAAKLDVIPKDLRKEAEIDLKASVIQLKSGGSPGTYAAPSAGSPFSSVQTPASGTPKATMSNDDIENIEANYERTKGRYASDESDDLFDKVSKAYVRNLGRVLEKKKAPEDRPE